MTFNLMPEASSGRRILVAQQQLIRRLLESRRPAGYWEGALSSDIQATAAAAIALHETGHPAPAERALGYLSSCRNDDGGSGYAAGLPSDLDSSVAALTAFQVCDRSGRHREQREGLLAYCTQREFKTSSSASRLLLHLGGFDVPMAPPAVDPRKLPYPERMTLELVSAYRAGDTDKILGSSVLIDGERSWRGLVTISGIACACVARSHVRDEASARWLLRCQNRDGGFPHTHSLAVWDTVIASLALLDAGVGPGSATWLSSIQDAGGGWYWDAESRSTVDFDDTGYALWVLLRSGVPRTDPGVQRAIEFLHAAQSPDGGFATFERPGTTIERPYWNANAPDVTAHVLQGLHAAAASEPAMRGERWLRDSMVDGVWPGRWFKGELYSTLSALEVVDKRHVELSRTRDRILEHRNRDGGFGSPERSTIEETAWGAGALIEAGREGLELAEPSIEWLADRCEDPLPAHVGALPLFAKFYSDSIFPVAFMLATVNKYLKAKGLSR
jgi:prenyltransferase beta subunit